jgi:hypothetical protein
MQFPEADYLRYDPCEGSDAVITLRKVKLRTARISHACFLGTAPGGDNHQIQPGEIYRSERALVDGDYWGHYKVCVPCMDKWLADVGRPVKKEESNAA